MEASAQVFQDQPLENVPEGTILRHDEGSIYTQLGAAMLLDVEFLTPRQSKYEKRQDSPILSRKFFMSGIDEAASSAPTLFRSNSRIIQQPGRNIIEVSPYRKYLVDPDQGQWYGRMIGVVVFAPTKENIVQPVMVSVWGSKNSRVRCVITVEDRATHGSIHGKNKPVDAYTIGTSYESEALRLRVRSAKLCTQGSLSYNKAKAKRARRTVLNFARNPSPA